MLLTGPQASRFEMFLKAEPEELGSRRDPELHVDVPKVVLDRVGAEEELRPHLPVRGSGFYVYLYFWRVGRRAGSLAILDA
jgi:hypothetical protein